MQGLTCGQQNIKALENTPTSQEEQGDTVQSQAALMAQGKKSPEFNLNLFSQN